MTKYFDVKKPLPKLGVVILSFLGILIFIILWNLIAKFGNVKTIFLPTPTETVYAIINLFQYHGFLGEILLSLYRILLGFMASLVLAFPLGLLLGSFDFFKNLMEPLVNFIRYIPPVAFIPLTILWFGIGDLQKGIVIFISVFPYLLVLFIDVVARVPQEHIDTAKALGFSRTRTLLYVVLPYSLPGYLDATRAMFGTAWTFIIVAEMIAASQGVGFLIIQSQRFIKTENIFAVIIIIGLIGLFSDLLFKWIYSKLFFWSDKAK